MGNLELGVEQLLLDPTNPRVESAPSQRDEMQRLLDDQGDRLFALAEDIVENGMSPIERLLVMRSKKDKHKYICLEGNRRVLALKLLSNPALIGSLETKESFKKRFEKLQHDFKKKPIKKIDCFEVGSREEARRWILLRHTGENQGRGLVGWSAIASARFRGQEPALQALDFVTRYGNLSAADLETITKSFPITTLDRMLMSLDVRKLLGFDVEEGKLMSGLPPEQLIKPLRRLVLDLAFKNKTVSDLKTKEQQAKYVKELEPEDRPDLKKLGGSRPVEDVKAADFRKTLAKPVRRRRLSDAERRTLAPKSLRLNIPIAKIADIYKELQSLRMDECKHSCAVLLRVFLELSVDSLLERHKVSLESVDPGGHRHDKSLKKKISEAIDLLVTKDGCEKKDFLGVTRGLSIDHSPLFVDLLHGYVHNRFVIPHKKDLKIGWDQAQRFFESIWK